MHAHTPDSHGSFRVEIFRVEFFLLTRQTKLRDAVTLVQTGLSQRVISVAKSPRGHPQTADTKSRVLTLR